MRRILVKAVAHANRTGRRGLTREAIVARALEIGSAEGLEAVSLRRLASDLGVTPMALYRHVRDKQDLVNAMTEVVLEGFDLTAGFEPSMGWADRLRRALENFRDQMEARPLALPLAIAYSGDGPPGFWKMMEDLLGILLGAGFGRREAIVLIRVLSNLVAGYLLLVRQGRPDGLERLDAQGLDLLRRRVELVPLGLPRDRFPHSVASAREVAEVWVADPDLWWRDTVDLIVFGLERMLERGRGR
ncbi:MAG TPA: TetR family transcriptional regulator [Candidatus Dormibacteraeota bacterium]|nr:TetR family transcriptional regulator [Candidatus Dormibacteraeota bacterium]